MTLHRLRGDRFDSHEDLRAYVRPESFDREGVSWRWVYIEGLTALLISGSTPPTDASWCGAMGSVTSSPVDEQTQSAFLVLLIRTDKAVYAVTCGTGHWMIPHDRFDPGFGLEFAIRCLDEGRITKVRRHLMDARGRVDENSILGGGSINGFGMERFGEIVSRIAGRIKDVPLTFSTGRKRATLVSAGPSSLTLRMGTAPADFLQDLLQIERVCERDSRLPEFDFIAQIRPVDRRSDQARRLDEKLDAMLGAGELGSIGLVVPSSCYEHYEHAESFCVTTGPATFHKSEIAVGDLVASVRRRPPGTHLSALRQASVTMFEDGHASHPLGGPTRADYWLTAELVDAIVHHFYWQGDWYEIGATYLDVIERRIAELLGRPTTVSMPLWPRGATEWTYNHECVAAQAGYVALDKDTIHTKRLRGGGLEICDVIGPEGQLICVKKVARTEAVNHLLAQGRVSVETLRYDAAAREKAIAKIRELAPELELDTSFTSPRLVYAILLDNNKPVTTDSLFAFAKVSLVHTATVLQAMGIRLEIVSLSRGR
ncbi:DUF6119 family protein [Nocardia beijingensis]|uniref:DUF6119 family protein n=1 Tax=Nocardia beijingensis TaxID=95162 RepID=UPI001C3F8703|nr:DUF6119 family protein [Nocardia beijingensis]